MIGTQSTGAMPWPGVDLSDAEIDEICDGLTQSAAKVRFLKALGLIVARKPNGRPLVSRRHFEDVRGHGQQASAKSNPTTEPRWSK